MSRISIEQIKQELEPSGWSLVSTTYKNLDENLEFKCDKGHIVVSSWRKIRNNKICPTCMKDNLKIKASKRFKKSPSDYRILALDQATRTTGYAIFNNKNLIDYGSFQAEGNTDIERSVQIKQWMISLVDNFGIDFVGLEGVQYQKEMGVTTFEVLSRLQGVLSAACVEENIPYKVVNTNTWRTHCGVKGRSRPDRKRSMQELVKQWYDIKPTEDECDAMGIGKYFCDTQVPQVEIVDWENGG